MTVAAELGTAAVNFITAFASASFQGLSKDNESQFLNFRVP
jgi:hypothetical protein